MSQEKTKGNAAREIEELIEVMAKLRGPGGCPWDREQDHQSLAGYLLQETYEVLDALEKGADGEICEELGDLLLQIVFHAQVARETGNFDFADICRGIKEKLIRRHPHVFGEGKVQDSAEVSKNWEAIKKEEKKTRKSMLTGVSRSQPALLEAEELQSRARTVGFDWPEVEGALEKVSEELQELKEAISSENGPTEEELGDLLFAVVNVGRFLNIDGELALRKTNSKFRRRFAFIESELKKQGKEPQESNLEEMDKIWEKSKEEPRE